MSTAPVAAIILAAGQGTRMKSSLHKVLHPIGGLPMLMHLIASVDSLTPAKKIVVVGAAREQVEDALTDTDVLTAHQAEQRGTGHAVLQAREALAGFSGKVVILYADVPFVSSATISRLLDTLDDDRRPAAAVLAFRAADPAAYGRVIAGASGEIDKMVEFKDASADERKIDLCNSGLLAARAEDLWRLLERVDDKNAAGEFYLPDIVRHAAAEGRPSLVVETDEAEVMGVNSRAELARAERTFQELRREEMMAAGVSLTDPDSTFFSWDTEIANDVSVEPNVVFGPGVRIESGARIRAHSHIEGAHVGPDCEVGPFARLRPGARMEAKAKVGNFVEMKKTTLGEGAKANHLTYLGDAEVGADANIGAGTITCNYDGYFKYRTVIGDGAFIGSNSALVAPVTIGAGAIVGAGSTISRDVDADALAVERADQTAKPDWAKRFRQRMTNRKKSG